MQSLKQQIRFCTSRDGTRIAYATCGGGPPLLWSPSWTHHLELDWESPIWRPWLDLLARRHTLVRYDWRGCGLSDQRSVEFSFENDVEDLAAVMTAARLQRCTLFGHEGAGAVCLAYAAKHPAAVERLVLYASPARGRFARGITPADVTEAETRLQVIQLGWHDEVPAFARFLTALHMPDASAERQTAYNALIRATTRPENAVAILKSFYRIDVAALVPQVRCPTLILHPRKDGIVPFEEGRQLAAHIGNSQFVPLDSRNHVLLDTDAAWPQFVAAVEGFLLSSGQQTRASGLLASLTPREIEVLELVARGLDNGTIAKQLAISVRTARNHVSSILGKLEIHSRARAIVEARDAGLGQGKSTR